MSGAQERGSFAVAAAETCCVYSCGELRTRFLLHDEDAQRNAAPTATVFPSYNNVEAEELRREQFAFVALKQGKACAGVVTAAEPSQHSSSQSSPDASGPDPVQQGYRKNPAARLGSTSS